MPCPLDASRIGDASASAPSSKIMKLARSQSFSFVSTARHLGLRASRDLVIWRSIWMLTVGLEVLAVTAVGVVVPMLRSPILVHVMLLRACARNKLPIRSSVSSSHWDLSRDLLRVDRCDISKLLSRAHAIHWLLMALLRTLVHHHWSSSSRAIRIPIYPHHRRLTIVGW